MPLKGWISLHRKISEDEIWFLEKFTKAQAWIDLILNANHKSQQIDIRGNLIVIKRGQIGWSELTMSKRWKWSRGKIRRFLKWLEDDRKIVQQKDRYITTITTILKYEKYQKVQQEDSRQDSRQDINNNVNKKEIYSRVINYLNIKTKKNYKISSKKTQSLINARINDGFEPEDFKIVIDIKCKEWIDDPVNNKFLRPETLFGNKFEGYLNDKGEEKEDNDKYWKSIL